MILTLWFEQIIEITIKTTYYWAKLVQYKWIVLSNTTLGTLMSSLDSNIVIVAIPTIARELPKTSFFDLLWVLLGYQLVTASVLVNFGRLSDMFGRVKLYNIGFIVFTAGSALSSIAQTGLQLVAFRMVQALGAAFLFSNSAAIITDAFPVNERGRALGTNQVAIVVGSVTGLVLGGFLTSFAGWRSIFWVNIPIGIFATVWSHYRLKELAKLERKHSIDIYGNLAFVAGLACILTSITLHAIGALDLLESVIVATAGLAFLAFFIAIERRVSNPMFNLSLFKNRMFTAGNVAIFLNALARGAVSLVLILYLQGPSMGLDPLTAGIYLTPMSASLAVLGPVSGWLSDRYGARILASLGLLVSSLGFLMLSEIGARITFLQLLIPLILIGGGMGIFASPNRASIMNSVEPEERGLTAGVSTTLVNVGSTFSLGLAFAIITAGVPSSELQLILLGSKVGADQGLIHNFLHSIDLIYYISTIFQLVAIIPSLMRGRGKSS
ncbi:MAG: MFS transporter [Conexivisphaerales archaeon]